MNARQVEAKERSSARPGLKPTEREKLVRRAKAAYLDPDVRRGDWEARYPVDVRDEALERMTLEERRCRG